MATQWIGLSVFFNGLTRADDIQYVKPPGRRLSLPNPPPLLSTPLAFGQHLPTCDGRAIIFSAAIDAAAAYDQRNATWADMRLCTRRTLMHGRASRFGFRQSSAYSGCVFGRPNEYCGSDLKCAIM
jgi:hypothetical protein